MMHAHCVMDNQVYKHTLTVYNTYCFSLQKGLQERAYMFRYTQVASLACFNFELVADGRVLLSLRAQVKYRSSELYWSICLSRRHCSGYITLL